MKNPEHPRGSRAGSREHWPVVIVHPGGHSYGATKEDAVTEILGSDTSRGEAVTQPLLPESAWDESV